MAAKSMKAKLAERTGNGSLPTVANCRYLGACWACGDKPSGRMRAIVIDDGDGATWLYATHANGPCGGPEGEKAVREHHDLHWGRLYRGEPPVKHRQAECEVCQRMKALIEEAAAVV